MFRRVRRAAASRSTGAGWLTHFPHIGMISDFLWANNFIYPFMSFILTSQKQVQGVTPPSECATLPTLDHLGLSDFDQYVLHTWAVCYAVPAQ